MAKNIYVGDSNNIARKVSKIYVGDSNNVARKVLKGYVGDSNNIARQFFDSEYIYLNYIKGTGTQYINSGINPNETMEIEANYKVDNFTLTTNNYIFGTQKATSTPNYDICRCQFAHRNAWLSGFGASYEYPHSSSTNKVYNVRLDKGKFYVDNNLIVDITASASEFTDSLNIYIMALNKDNNALNISNTTIYYLKMKKNNVLVRDFVPVIRKSDNAVGLLDRVTNTFFGNAGTGTFLYG